MDIMDFYLLFKALNTKIIKYIEDSIAREIIIFGLTFFAVLGVYNG